MSEPTPYRNQPIRAFGESEVRIVSNHAIIPDHLVPERGPTLVQRQMYLDRFSFTGHKFGKIPQSKAWDMLNFLIRSTNDRNNSHLFQIQHDWDALLGEEIDRLEHEWGQPEFAQVHDPLDFLNALIAKGSPVQGVKYIDSTPGADEVTPLGNSKPLRLLKDLNALNPQLSSDEYIARRKQLSEEMGIPWHDMDENRVFRKHVFATRSHDAVSIAMTERTPHYQSSELLIPYPFSYFEFFMDDEYWLVEVIEREDKTAALKYHFNYENKWHQATHREYEDCEVFRLLKRQVIGALIALEAKAASKVTHDQALTPPTPAMMERLKKVFKQEFNFGYSIIELTKQTKKGVGTSVCQESKVRLHFRRGHWRDWLGVPKCVRVRWALVGDPALGFVDKHYRF